VLDISVTLSEPGKDGEHKYKVAVVFLRGFDEFIYIVAGQYAGIVMNAPVFGNVHGQQRVFYEQIGFKAVCEEALNSLLTFRTALAE